MPVTVEGQVDIDGRVTLGPDTPYLILGTKVHSLPEVRTQDRPRPGTHGEDPAPLDLMGKRLNEYRVLVRGTAVIGDPSTREAVRINMDALLAVVGYHQLDALQTLTTWPLGNPTVETMYGRARRLAWVDEDTIKYGYVEGILVFEATDPIRYGDAQVRAVALAEPSGGRAYPKTYPRAYGNVGIPNTTSAENDGTFPVFPTFTVTGPVTNPRIEHIETGAKLEVGIVLGPTDFLTLDAEAATVMLNGSASRYNLLTLDSTWFPLTPGVNTIRYSAGGVEVGSTVTVNYRDGRI